MKHFYRKLPFIILIITIIVWCFDSVIINLIQNKNNDIIRNIIYPTNYNIVIRLIIIIVIFYLVFYILNILDKLKNCKNEITKKYSMLEENYKNQINKLNKSQEQLDFEIADRKIVEMEINKFQMAIEQSPNIVVIADVNFNIEYANSIYYKKTCFKKEDVIGSDLIDIDNNIESEKKTIIKDLIQNGEIWKYEYPVKDIEKNKEYWAAISISPIKNNEGIITNYLKIEKDITNLRNIEKELLKTKGLSDNIINSMIDSLIMIDSDRKIIKINRTTSKMLGYSKDELINKDLFQIIEMNNLKTEEEIQLNNINKNIIKMEGLNYKTKDNELIPISFTASPIIDIDYKSTGSICIAQDITDKIEMEAQIIQSEKLSALGELTAGIAHELNQPLNSIKIISQSIVMDIDEYPKDELETDLNDIIQQVNKMAEIIDHMRVFTRRTEGVIKENININSIVEASFKFIGQQLFVHDIYIEKKLTENLPEILGDPIRLEQVMLNMITNARNALESIERERKVINVDTYQEENKIIISISDNGCGIPEKIRKKIFQPFFTTHEPGKGTGLGLSVSSQIIKEHNGEIVCESKEEIGTTFKLIFYLNQDN